MTPPTASIDTPLCCIVVVNYRTSGLVLRCLSALASERSRPTPAFVVVVVDNASGDGSFDILSDGVSAAGWAHWIRVVSNPVNAGFGAGNNLGFRLACQWFPTIDTIALLNPDAVPHPGWLSALLTRLKSDEHVGIVGSAIVDEFGRQAAAAHRFHSPLGELERAVAFEPVSRWLEPWCVTPRQASVAHCCHWVSGASLALRREVMDAVGGFDEEFFLYFEEVDLCWRAARRGWQCWYEPGSCVTHAEGSATGITRAKRRLPDYWYASRRHFFIKAHGFPGLVIADFLWATGRLSLVVRRTLRLGGKEGHSSEPRSMSLDLLWGDARALVLWLFRRVSK